MEAFDVSAVTIAALPRAFVEQGLEVALQRKKPDRDYEYVLDGEGEAHLIALAWSEPPTGRKHSSLRLLQDRFVKLGHGAASPMKPLNPRKSDDSWNDLNSTLHPSMAIGSIWPKLN
jgi:hypothetical protein